MSNVGLGESKLPAQHCFATAIAVALAFYEADAQKANIYSNNCKFRTVSGASVGFLSSLPRIGLQKTLKL